MKAGIDYSMTAPAIYIEDDNGVGKWYLMQETLRLVQEEADLSIVRIAPYESKIDRAIALADWTLNCLNAHGIKEVNIEGFSMASTGAVFDIGAHSGIMYARLYDAGIKINMIPPSNAKQSFSGKGNANKELMCTTFKNLKGFAFSERLKTKVNESPENDLVDAYAIAHTPVLKTVGAKKMFC